MSTLKTLLSVLVLVFSSLAMAAEYHFDVVIYGGSSAAVTAAVQAAKMGKTVAIVCPDKHLGGLSSAGLGATDSGDRSVIGGLSREFYHRLWLHYQKPESWNWTAAPNLDIPGQGGRGFDFETKTAWIFEPHVAESVFEGFIHEFHLEKCVFRGQYLDRSTKNSGVIKDGAKLVGIKTVSGDVFYGRMFIDATYEGDLMAQAGVSFTVGRESNAQYGETLDGVQVRQARYHQFSSEVDPYVKKGDPSSGLLPMINAEVAPDGTADSRLQAYCYRFCMTQVSENRVRFEKPEGYNPLDYELFLRSVEQGEKLLMANSTMPNGKTDTNNNGPVSMDYIGGNYDYLDASDAEREAICKKHEQWQRGLMWTLQNDPRVPEEVRREYGEWGLSKDEFLDTNHVGHKIYVREGRRMVSDFVHTEMHCRRLLPTPRPVGFGSYNMDSHHCQRHLVKTADGKVVVRNEGDVQVSPRGAYPIDYGALIPKQAECENLLVCVCVSCSHIAYGSIRMEPVFMILGQSAATAACIALDDGIPVQKVSYPKLAEQLKANGQRIDCVLTLPAFVSQVKAENLPGKVLDDSQAVLEGDWQHGEVVFPFVEAGYLHDGDANKGQLSATFTIPLDESGEYEVSVSYSPHYNRATNVPITVQSEDGEKTVRINQRWAADRGGLFQPIGTFRFKDNAVVKISNQGTDGHVLVDAVMVNALPKK